MRILRAAILAGPLYACDDPAFYHPVFCESIVGQQAQSALVLRFTGQSLAEILEGLSGTYELGRVLPEGGGAGCDMPTVLRLEAEATADMHMEFCQETLDGFKRFEFRPFLTDQVTFVAHCQIEDVGAATPCTVRIGRPETHVSLFLEVGGGGYFSARWASDGHLTSGYTTTEDGALLRTVCTGPRTPTPFPPDP